LALLRPTENFYALVVHQPEINLHPTKKTHIFKNIPFVLGAKLLLFYQSGDLIFVIKLKFKNE